MAAQWDQGQLALFEALGSIVERVGRESAQELANKVSSKPTRQFLSKLHEAEENEKIIDDVEDILGKAGISMSDEDWDDQLAQLIVKARILDSLKQNSSKGDSVLEDVVANFEETEAAELAKELQMLRMRAGMLDAVLSCPPAELKAHVQAVREKLGVAYPGDSIRPLDAAAEQAPTPGPDSSQVTEFVATIPQSKDKELEAYRKRTNEKLKKVLDANKTMQNKLRQVADNRNRWSKYAEHLEKKLETSNALLGENKLPLPPPSRATTTDPAEVEQRPQALERDMSTDVVQKEPSPSEEGPNLTGRIRGMAASSQEEGQAAAVAGRTALPTQQSGPFNGMTGQKVEADLSRHDSHPQAAKTTSNQFMLAPHGVLPRPFEMGDLAHSTPETYAKFITKLTEYNRQRGTIFDPRPRIGTTLVDLHKLYQYVIGRGGYDTLSQKTSGWAVLAKTLDFGPKAALQLRTLYYKYLAAYEIEHYWGQEPPPWEILEDVPLKTGPLLTRTLENFATDAQRLAVNQRLRRETAAMGASKGRADSTAAASPTDAPAPPTLQHSSSLPEPLSDPPSPKLPKLIHATTVPDSLASSSSLSAVHTSSTQAEHPTSGADTINAAEANETNAAAAAAMRPPSDDEPPVVVSARQLRKRKPTGSSPVKKKIKQERLASSPIALLGLRHLQTQESMDLDEIGPKTATPKKRREKLGGIGQEYVPAQDRVYEHPPDFMDAMLLDTHGTPGTPVERPSLPGTPGALTSAASVLKPRSVNTPVLPRTSAKLRSAKRRRIEDTEKGAQLFSEDGENHLAPYDAETAETPSRLLPAVRATRLSNLLEKPSPRRWQVMNMDDEPDYDDSAIAGLESAIKPRQPVPQALAAQPVEPQEDYGDDLPTMEDVIKRSSSGAPASVLNAPFHTPAPQNRPANLNKYGRKVREDVPSTARPEEEPLATRSVSRLSLDDFRINPEYNNGLDYAYRDVVRGREKRKCLAGCTDPSCCGKGFRALAEIATPIREHVTSAQKEEEDKLLKEFIGRDADRLLRTMTREERRETLIKAKTRELANKHGKHRHAYERRKSPPGFWRTDFPTTQEEAEDREKAKEFERDLVQKRYEEAMRGGGKWIFKDQKGGQPHWVAKD